MSRRICVRSFSVMGIVAAMALTAAACGGSDKASTTTSKATTTTSKATTTTKPTSSTTAAGGTSASVWQQDAQQYRGQNGTTYTLACPAGGKADSVWGAGVYTDDSSICTAGVQSGLITIAKGGDVTYKIGPVQDAYDAGTANGVTSSSYGRWDGSFTFPDAPPGTVTMSVGPESWSRNVSAERGQNGTRVTVQCSPSGTLGSVWGSDPYTDDSSVCTAGVHAGVVTLAAGGTVVVEMASGQGSYKGSTANGVTSSDFGSFGGSFTIPKDQKPG